MSQFLKRPCPSIDWSSWSWENFDCKIYWWMLKETNNCSFNGWSKWSSPFERIKENLCGFTTWYFCQRNV